MNFIIANWDKIATAFFAALSTFFAALSFIVLYKEYLRNNPKIEVKMNKAFVPFRDNLVDYVHCCIVNKGRRKINVNGFFFLLKNGEKLIFYPQNNPNFLPSFPQFPKTIDETEALEFSIPLIELENGIKRSSSKVKALCFIDTKDEVYSYKIHKKYWKSLFN